MSSTKRQRRGLHQFGLYNSSHILPTFRYNSHSKPCCMKCGYSHPNGKCPAKGQQCYACGGYNHYTVLCQQKGCWQNKKQQQRGFKPNKHSYSCGHHSSHLPHRHCCRGHILCSHSRDPILQPLMQSYLWHIAQVLLLFQKVQTPHRYYWDVIDVIPADSITTGN